MNKLSLFSGIGGDDLASDWAGINTVCFVERDKYCQKILKKHWPDIPIIEDVHEVKREKIKATIDIIGGGFPCQPVSCAGKRRGKEDDRWLWPEMFRLVQEFKPTWVVGENVAGLITLGLQDVLFDLESVGYETQSFLIPACAINAWHRRDRVFIIAYCKSLYGALCNKERGGGLHQFRGYIEGYANPRSIRTIHGIPSGLDRCRLKALGNSCVPQQIYPIYKAIVEIEQIKGRE